MALTQANLGRAYSIGPTKQQRVSIAAASGDTSGTITFDSLTDVSSVLISTLQVKTQSISGNVVTVTFTDPVATVVGVAEAHGV
jgi:hypothetical protein